MDRADRFRQFSVLGPLVVTVDGTEIELGGAKQRLVLAALVLAGGRLVSTDRLIRLVWAEAPPARPVEALRSYISNIRRLLEPDRAAGDRSGALVTRSPGYALIVDRAEVDARRFEDHVQAAARLLADGRPDGASAEIEAGLALWRSDDLADSPVTLLAGEATRLLELRDQAVDLGYEALLAAGRHREAIPDLQRVATAEPWRHRALGHLMLALHRAGRSAEAVRAYRAGVEAAIESTGLEPPAALGELEQRILAGDPDLAWRPPAGSEPEPPTPLVHLQRPAGLAVGTPPTVARSALRAARDLAADHDHRGAIDLVERGLSVLGLGEDAPDIEADLLIQLAQERKFLEHYTQAHAAARSAFELAERVDDLDRMISAALVFCGQWPVEDHHGLYWLGYWNPPAPALEMLSRCLERVPSNGRRVVLLMAYGSQLFGQHEDPPATAEVLAEAVTLARSLGKPQLLATALSHELTIRQRDLARDERTARAEECLAIAVTNGMAAREMAARRALMVLRLDDGQIDEARKQVGLSEALAAQTGHAFLAMLAGSMETAVDILAGRLAEAEARLLDAMTRYEHLGAGAVDLLGIQLTVLRREQGRLDDVESLLVWRLAGYPGPAYGAALALVKAEMCKYDEARDVLDHYSDPAVVDRAEGVMQFTVLQLQAEAALAAGTVSRMAPLYEALEPGGGRIVAMFNGIALFGSTSLVLGRLALALGHLEAADGHLRDAQRHHDSLRAVPYQIRTAAARAQLARVRGRPEEADLFVAAAGELAGGSPLAWLIEPPQHGSGGA